MRDEEVVQCEVRVKAKPETIFPFFIDPKKMVKWKGIEAVLDPRPGGVYSVNVTGRDKALGKYVEVTPFRRVVITWGWEGEGHPIPPGSTTVEITLHPEGDTTLVRLRHTGLTKAAQEQHEAGWVHYLGRLTTAAEGRNAGPDPMVGGGKM
ncbi:MAG: transcriptional regulator [SAR202 cluster bacterium]|nr:transcriptional regulator [SAR202 cluster bacterium]